MRKPIELTQGLWLELPPTRFRTTEIGGTGKTLRLVVELEAYPRIVAGRRPHPDPVAELPPLEVAPIEPVFLIHADARAPLELVNRTLKEKVAGRTIEGDRPVHVRKAEIRRIEDSNAPALYLDLDVEEIAFFRSIRMQLWATGAIVWDPSTKRLAVSDFDFSVRSRRLLIRGLQWLFGERMRRKFEQALSDVVGDAGERVLESLRGVEREVAPGVVVALDVDGLRPQGIRLDGDMLVTRVELQGEFRVRVAPRGAGPSKKEVRPLCERLEFESNPRRAKKPTY